jgi:hypothetical protein
MHNLPTCACANQRFKMQRLKQSVCFLSTESLCLLLKIEYKKGGRNQQQHLLLPLRMFAYQLIKSEGKKAKRTSLAGIK